jgi:hypothetical protein
MKSLLSSLVNKKTFASILAVLSIVGYGAFVFAVGPFAPGTELDPACSPYINNDPNQGVDTDCTVTTSSGGSRWSLAGGTGPDIYFDGGNVGVGADDPQFNFQVGDQTSDSILFLADSNSSIFDATKGFVGSIQTTAGFTAFTGLAEELSFLGPGVGFLGSGFFGDGTTRGLSGMTNIESNDYGIIGRSVARWLTLVENTMDDGSEFVLAMDIGSQNTAAFQSIANASFNDNTFSSSRILNNIGQLADGGAPVISFDTTSDRSGSELKNEFSFNTQGFGFGNTSSFSGLVNNSETNKFYFDYENQAIRLGSVDNDAWDIGSGNVGNKSVAIGFSATALDPSLTAPIASGLASFSLGTANSSTGTASFTIGIRNQAQNDNDYIIGNENQTIATGFGNNYIFGDVNTIELTEISAGLGQNSYIVGNENIVNSHLGFIFGRQNTVTKNFATAIGQDHTVAAERGFAVGNGNDVQRQFGFAIGNDATAYASSEMVFNQTTAYTPSDTPSDRAFAFGIGGADALTILQNGLTGVGFDNFEVTGNSELLQVNGDILADAFTLSSDRNLKTDISEIALGLDIVHQLKPVSYTFIKNNTHQLGFIAQEVQTILPELVTEGNHLSLNYVGLIPVLTKAIQELDLKLENIQSASTVVVSGGFSLDGLRDWLGDKLNGINKLFVRELCLTDGVEEECITMDELRQLKQSAQLSSDSNNSDSSNDDASENDQEVSNDTVVPEDLPNGSEEIITPEEPSEEVVTDSPEEAVTESGSVEPAEPSEPADSTESDDSSSSDSSSDTTDSSVEITQ